MTFWDWALEVYARPGVSDACLQLQDSHGQCASYLLWAAWAAHEGRALDARTLARGASLARTWEKTAVRPLRQARRGMKAPLPGMADDAREAARGQVKAAELAAERVLMLSLEALVPQERGAAPALFAALADAARAWGDAPPTEALRDLLENLAER